MNLTPSGAGQALRMFVDSDTPPEFGGALVYIKSNSPSSSLYRLLPTSTLAQRFLELDLSHANDWSRQSLINYIPGRKIPDGHLMHTPAETVSLLESFSLDTISKRNVPLFKPREHVIDRPRMTITIVNRGDLHATFFRFMRPSARLKRSRVIATVFRDPTFDTLDDEVFIFNESVDAIAVSDQMYLINRNNFDRYFEFVVLMRQRAAEVFEMVTKNLAIDGLPELRAAATSDINMMSKLASIQRKIDLHPEYQNALQMDRLLDFIDNNSHVEVDLAGEGAERRLVFIGSNERRWKILKLLDDDYLKSGLTDLEYEVDSKGDPLGT